MIERELFLENFRELFDETPIEEIQFETRFRNLDEWSSLIVLSLIVHFEDNYKVKLNLEVIDKCNTIEDLFNLV